MDYYLRLKNKYDSAYNSNKKKIIKNNDLSKEEKKQLVKGIVRKCVNCRKPGGTVFSFENNIYKCYCNSSGKKCKLNIEFIKPKFINLFEMKKERNEILKSQIYNLIKNKVNIMHELVNEDEGLKIFEKQQVELNELKNELEIIKGAIEYNTHLYYDVKVDEETNETEKKYMHRKEAAKLETVKLANKIN